MSPHSPPPVSGPLRIIPLLGVLLFFTVLLLDVVRLEQIPWSATLDDGAYAAAGYSLVRTGRAGLPMARGVAGLERDMVMYGRIPAAAVGLSQFALGVSSFADRLPSLLAVVVSAGVVVELARLCGLSATISAAAGLLWFISVPARILSHSGRPDTLMMLFTLLGTWLLRQGLESGRVWPAGLVAGASLEVHMIGSTLILALGAATWLLSPTGRRWRHALLFALAAVPGVAVWLCVHVFSQWELWTLQWGTLWGRSAPAPILLGPGAILAAIGRRYAAWYWNAAYHRYLFEVPFLLGAVVAGWRNLRLRSLAIVVVAFHAMLALFAPGAHPGYIFAVQPLLSILMVSAFFASPRIFWRACGLSLLVFYLAQTAYWVARPDRPLPPQAAQDIQRYVEDKAFLGADSLWFRFPPGFSLYSVVTATLIRTITSDSEWESAYGQYLRGHNVEFVVVDKEFQDYVSPAERAFFERHSSLLQEYHYKGGRWIRIYRLELRGAT